MKKTKILAMLLCIVLLFSCVSLFSCNEEPDEGKTPDDTVADGTDKGEEKPPVDPDDEEEEDDSEDYKDSKLYGKTVIWNGDSICQGATATGTWADRIAIRNGLTTWKNYGVGGGTITENVLVASTGKTRHSVSATLEKMHEEFPDADYIILEGGTNDADLIGRITEGETPERFGTFDPDDFSGNYDRDTFCGALESTFYRAKQYWSGKKICYIVAQKMGIHAPTSENRYAYFEMAMLICEKWDIPYLNLWDDCELDPNDLDMYDPSKTADQNEEVSMYRDSQHLTSAGYDLTAAIIDAWLQTL